jgi:HK97 gp10 family phage protein
MAQSSVTMTGLPGVDRALRQFEPKTREKIEKQAARTAAKVVQKRAQQHAPVDEGDLRKSIKVRALKRSRKNRKVGVRVVTSASDNLFQGKQFYGGFLEYGTAYIAPRPFMRRAATETRAEVYQIFRQQVARIIRETANEVRPRKTTAASKGALKFAGVI